MAAGRDQRPSRSSQGRRSNGDVVRFDHRNGALGVFRGDVIVAYFRPDEGYEYFLREIAK